MIKEARENPSALAGEQVREMLWAMVALPIIVGLVFVILFFIMGYTHLFGFQAGFFRFLFWVSCVVGFVFFSFIRKMISSIGRGAMKQTKAVVDAVASEKSPEKNE